MTELILLGAGAAGLEIAEAILQSAAQGLPVKLLGFLDDDDAAGGFPEHGIAMLGAIDRVQAYPQASFLIGIASHRNMAQRQRMALRLDLPAQRYFTFVHPGAQVSPTAVLGHGVAVMHGAVVNLRARVADHVMVCQSAIVGHDAEIGAGCVIAPAATISGRVRIGRGTYIGAAAAIAPDLTIGEGALVGIGLAVNESLAPGARVIGNPSIAQRLRP